MSCCNGICCRHQVLKPLGVGRYESGQSFCSLCDVFMEYPGLFCPCCNYRLRRNPRNGAARKRYKETLRIQ